MGLEAVPDKPLKSKISQLFDSNLDALRKLGFSPNENGLKWLDLVFLAPELNWKDASKIILHSVAESRKAIAAGRINEDFGEELTDSAISQLRFIFANAAKVLNQKSSDKLTPQISNAMTLTILPDNIATSVVGLVREEDQQILKLSLDYFESFFSVVLKLAEKLPDQISEIMAGIKQECIAKYFFNAEEFPALKEVKNGIFHGMLFVYMDHSDWMNDQIAYLAICQDKKPAELYSAYKFLVKDVDASEYDSGIDRYQTLLKLDNRERSRIINILNAVKSERTMLFDFLVEYPEFRAIAERVGKSNNLVQDEALSLLVEYGRSENKKISTLLLALSNSTPKLNLVLNAEFLTALEGEDSTSLEKIQNFLVINNDPDCLRSIISSIQKGDELQVKLILEAQEIFLKEAEFKKKLILKIVALNTQQLPEILTRDIAVKLTAKTIIDPITTNATLASSSKRSDLILTNAELILAREVFNKYQCARLFREIINQEGEDSEVARTLCRHIGSFLKSNFYQATLDNHRMRRVYFQTVIRNPEYLCSFEQRLKDVGQLKSGNVHQEVELFASWVIAKELEKQKTGLVSVPAVGDADDHKVTVETTHLTIKAPPAFRRLLIVMPLERVNPLRTDFLAEIAPNILDIRTVDSEKFAPLKDIASNISDDSLVLYMTGSGSHSNFLAFKMALPAEHRARKLYLFKGKRELRQLLQILNDFV